MSQAREIKIKIPERKMVICLPIWEGEVEIAKQLLKLWADLEDAFNPKIAVAIVGRFDLDVQSAIGKEIIDYVGQKFLVFTHRVKKEAAGWPAGCNALELGAYEWFIEKNRGREDFSYDYMLIAEADTVPLRKGWANEIMDEAYDNKSVMLGAMLRKPDNYCEHINGNCVLNKDFFKKCRSIFLAPPHYGWDAFIGPSAIAYGTASRLIWQDYRLGAPDNPWKGDSFIFEPKFYKSERNPFYGKPVYPAMIHGIKSDYGIKAVRNKIFAEKS